MMYKTDYVFSWDFSDVDAPCVSISKIYAEKGTPHLLCTVLGGSYESTGVVSLMQLIESVERLERESAAQEKENKSGENDTEEADEE